MSLKGDCPHCGEMYCYHCWECGVEVAYDHKEGCMSDPSRKHRSVIFLFAAMLDPDVEINLDVIKWHGEPNDGAI